MNAGFYIILVAQFLSALADNALLIAAIALFAEIGAGKSLVPLLQGAFVVAYIVLAPFVGSFADALPKGRVMFISNNFKLIGCVALLAGMQPLAAYALVGIGAAGYSPAKYGILTEILPPSKLVAANGWMEGTTVAAIVLGAVLGSVLINPAVSAAALAVVPFADYLSPAKLAVLVIALFYFAAAVANLFIPFVPIDHRMAKRSPVYLLHDFWHAFTLLWRDPLGKVSLAVTTLFWGVGATLKLVIIDWAAHSLGYRLDQATLLTVVVALGIALGAGISGYLITLERSLRVLPAGIAMGVLVVLLTPLHQEVLVFAVLFLIGALGGFFLVPLNALLQHRGHLLMGAGHSIAIQNFNENLSILVLSSAYSGMLGADLNIYAVVVIFGLFISGTMWAIWRRFRHIEAHV